MTQLLSVHEGNPDARHLDQACRILQQDGIVLLPTETGYALVGSADGRRTRERLVALRKAHPRQKPFSVLCRDLAQVSSLASLPTAVYRLAKRLWPGPYTLILEATRHTPQTSFSSASKKTVGVRIPSHPIAAALVSRWEGALLVTSITDAEELLALDYYENPQVEEGWWTTAERILEQVATGIDLALGVEDPIPLRVSTVLDCTAEPPEVLRDGGWGELSD